VIFFLHTALAPLSKAIDDADVAEMAEHHDVKEILQLTRKYVANVQATYGK